ncbi:MAG TPA: hypothetical protein VJY33_23240 [Isosphaeraceae bacterium]|nr:hypothetical protein [Isosphaeraceae bacterium]
MPIRLVSLGQLFCSRTNAALSLILIITALGLRLWGIPSDLPVYYEKGDEGEIIRIAMSLGGDPDPHTFFNPSLYPYVLLTAFGAFFAAGKAMGSFANSADFANYYFHHLSIFYLIARSISVLFGVASVGLTYLIGRKAYGPRAGLLASLLFTMEVLKGASRRPAIIAALFAGLAASAKYTAGVAWLGLVAALLLREKEPSVSGAGKEESIRRTLAGVALTGLVAAAGFFVGTPFALVHFGKCLHELREHAVYVSMFGDPFHSGGLTFWPSVHLQRFASPDKMGWPLAAACVAGLLYAFYRSTRADAVLLIVIGCLYVPLALPTQTYSPDSFLLPIVPLLILLAARLLDDHVSIAPRLRTAWVLWAGAAAVVALTGTVGLDRAAARSTTLEAAKQWIDKNIPRGSTILVDRTAPQLAFTPESWRRLIDLQMATHSKQESFHPSRRRSVSLGSQQGRLIELRDKAMTDFGVPYDLYLLLDRYEVFTSPPPPELDFYAQGAPRAIRVNCIQYIVVNTEMNNQYKSHLEKDLENGVLQERTRFYHEVEEGCVLLSAFRPGESLSGPEIRVYEAGRIARREAP